MKTRNLSKASRALATLPLAKESTLSTLPDFLRAFEENTGWPLRFVPGDPVPFDPEVVWASRIGTAVQSVGELRMSLGGMSPLLGHRADLEDAASLANAYSTLLCELLQTRDSLRKTVGQAAPDGCQVEPAKAGKNERSAGHEAIEKLLANAVRKLRASTALLYVLNDATTDLNLLFSNSLRGSSQVQSSRPLATANADLEAMSGYAVVIQAPQDRGEWNLPCACQAAVCLPIADETQVLGTLWVLADAPRHFSDRALEEVEVIAYQLAYELRTADHDQDASDSELEPALAF